MGSAEGPLQRLFDRGEGGFPAQWDAGITYMFRGVIDAGDGTQHLYYFGQQVQRKRQLLHPATPYYPSPRGKFHTRGNISRHGGLLWADMNAATPPGALGCSSLCAGELGWCEEIRPY